MDRIEVGIKARCSDCGGEGRLEAGGYCPGCNGTGRALKWVDLDDLVSLILGRVSVRFVQTVGEAEEVI